MIETIWAKEFHCRHKARKTKTYLLSLSGKEIRHLNPPISYYVTIELLNQYKFWIQS